jgi:GT2 family glycosyltransferase
MRLSVIIATRRRPQFLADTLRSLAGADTAGLDWELLVVDNGGDPDANRGVVHDASQTLPVRLLCEASRGKNHAINRALTETSGSLVVFTDDDVIVDRQWLRELQDGAARWPNATMFGGRVRPRWPDGELPPRAHELFDHAFAIADFGNVEQPYSAGYVYGPNMAIRADVFRAGWRFNPAIGPDGTDRYISGSETSLTVALQKHGHQAVYLPRACVEHRIRPEQLRSEWLFRRAFRRGRTDACQKGYEGGWRRVPKSILGDAIREYAAWWRCRLAREEEGALDHGIKYWRARGAIYHCLSSIGAPPSGPLTPRFNA